MTSEVVPVCEMPTATSPAEQGRGGERGVHVGEVEGGAADAVQLLLEVGGDEAAGARAVDVHPAGRADRLDHLLADGRVELLGGFLDGPRVVEGDGRDDLRQVGTGRDVSADHPGVRRLHPAGGLGGQPDPQLRVAFHSDRPAEPDDRGLGGLGGGGEVGDGAPGGVGGIGDDQPGDPLLGRGQRREQATDVDDQSTRLVTRRNLRTLRHG
jgi:ATP-dependent RNA helicase RhlE